MLFRSVIVIAAIMETMQAMRTVLAAAAANALKCADGIARTAQTTVAAQALTMLLAVISALVARTHGSPCRLQEMRTVAAAYPLPA